MYSGQNGLVLQHKYTESTGLKYGYQNDAGETVIPLQFDNASHFVDGTAVVSVDNKYGIIDNKGNYIKPLSKDIILSPSCNLIVASWEGKFGAYDNSGKKIVIPNKFEALYKFMKYKPKDLSL